MFVSRARSRALALAAALVLIGIAGPAIGAALPAVAPHPGTATPAVRPAATDYVYPTDASGYTTSAFPVSLYAGNVYFYAYDPSDSFATVTITDQNATRDGVANPAASWNASFAGGVYNYSYLWHQFYTLPFTLAHGGTWNLTISGANAGVFSTSFEVYVYQIQVSPDEGAYLPGHTATLTWSISATVNNAPFSGVTNLTAVGTYAMPNGSLAPLFGGQPKVLTPAPFGTFTVSIPTHAPTYSYVRVYLYANQSGAGGTSSVETDVALTVGALRPLSISLGTCPTGCTTNAFNANALAFYSATAWVSNGYGGVWPAQGLDVRFNFSANNVNLSSVPGQPPLTQVTNASGGVSILFLTDPAVFSTTHANRIAVNVTDPVYSNTSLHASTTFFVAAASQAPALLGLALGQIQYYSGDTLTGTWTLGAANPAALAGWQADSWYVEDLLTGGIRATGLITSTATSGSFTWTIPAGYQGSVDVLVTAHNATESIFAYAPATISAPEILLSPNEAYYHPGDTVTIAVGTVGSAFSGATLYGNAVGPSGGTFWSGTITGGSFSLSIPSVAPPSDLAISVAAQAPSAGLISTATLTLYEVTGYQLVAGIDTPSNYIDGSYQPGQTLTLHYTLTALGTFGLAKAYRVTVYPAVFGSGAGSQTFATTSASGTVSYTLPSSLPSGSVLFEIVVQLSGCTNYPCSASTLLSVPVEANPPVLGYQLGAGTGITVGWVILLALIVLVAFVAWRGFRGRRRPVMMTPVTPAPRSSPEPASGTEPTSGGGSSSGTSSSAKWQEEGGSGRPGSEAPPGSPPLPRSPGSP